MVIEPARGAALVAFGQGGLGGITSAMGYAASKSRVGRSAVLIAGGAAVSLPLSASALAAPAACACGGGGAPPPAPPEPPVGVEEANPEGTPLPAPPPRQPTPAPVPTPPSSLPRTPDAAEAWLEQEDEPEPAPAAEPEPAPEAESVSAPAPTPPSSLPRTPDAAEAWLEQEDEPEPAPQPEPEPAEPAPEPAATPRREQGEPEPAATPQRQVYGVDAELYRRLGPEDQQAIRQEYLGEMDPPPPPPPAYTPCSPVEYNHPDTCIEYPQSTHGSGPLLCVPGEGPAEDSCRTVTADESEDPAAAGAIWCHPLQGPYIGARPCSPGEAPPPSPPTISQGPSPSDDYESWRDPSRRERERFERFDEALPETREWEIGDFQGRDEGRLRFGLFIAEESSGVGPIQGEGDDRSFDTQFSPYATRAYVEVDFENDRAFVVSNPTCEPGGGCNDAKHLGDGALGDYSTEVTLEERDDGSVYIQYELANARLPGPLSGASIDGHITIRPDPHGTFEVNWFGDRYPSWEAYYDDACGTTWTMTQSEEGELTDLLPWVSDRDYTIYVPVHREQIC